MSAERPTRASSSSARFSRSARGSFERPKATFCRADRCGKQRVVLEHQADAPGLGRLVTAFAFNQPAADKYEAGVGTFEAGGDAQRCRFATAGLAEQAEDMTPRDIQGDTVQRHACAKALGDALQRQPV